MVETHHTVYVCSAVTYENPRQVVRVLKKTLSSLLFPFIFYSYLIENMTALLHDIGNNNNIIKSHLKYICILGISIGIII